VTGLRILVLRATRLVRHAPARSTATGLIVVVAVLVGSLWLSQSRGHAEALNSVSSQFGRADVRYDVSDHAATPIGQQTADVLETLPDESEVAVLQSFANLSARSEAAHTLVEVVQGPWSDPLLDGMVTLADGRLPRSGEVVVHPELAVSLGVDLGDRLVVHEPSVELEVVGLGTAGGWPRLLVAEGEFVLADDVAPGEVLGGPNAAVLATLPAGGPAPEVDVGTADVPQLVWPVERDDLGISAATSVSIVAVVLVFVGLSAGAAFAIGAARRRRSLGLLAANGATDDQLRLSAAAEALVVSVPAALLGVVTAVVVPALWVRWRLPGWDRLWQMVLPWPWAALLALAAVVASSVGTLAFSHPVAGATVPSLLDGRAPTRRSGSTGSSSRAWMVVVVLLALLVISPALGRVGMPGTAALGLVVWCAGAVVVVTVARRVLARHAVGRLVGRDLARRPLGAGAAVMVISVWTFGSVLATMTAGIGGDDAVEQTTAYVESGAPPERQFPLFTLQPPAAESLRHSSSPPTGEPTTLPGGLRRELDELGVTSQLATVGVFTGPCDVCPGDYRPTVMVLDSVDGLGLPAETETALRSGSVVIGIDLDGIEGSTVEGLPVTVAPLPLDANAAMLRQFGPGGSRLDDPVEALVGSTAGLSDAAVAKVANVLGDAGVELQSDDLRLHPVQDLGPFRSSSGRNWDGPLWAASALVLVFVTVAATVAYRREHREAAHVLWLLGAGPRVGRRLASLTAGTLATVGVLVGSTTAITAVTASWLARDDLAVRDVLEPSRLLGVVGLIVLVPVAASLLGRLLPPPRSVRTEVRPA
jgi:hypothetical protein